MPSSDDNRDGFRDGLESSSGDPRVLFAINALLSVLFAWLLVWVADIIDIVEFSAVNVALVAVGVFALTYVVTSP
ncbi:hypothetical protein G6M89_02690 [Natronolimnobius sp. AArcel1]|uniref:hypothetical protein n=1 Tax=Natronolimnobius sp. AArcel1 TaxID=1679093 RepID=UPI0013ED3321|nr:hypothetical protein [Natronolimnobius sp. AArcel1]NGM67929.1 hypothetical protein [Natronolimnobius sp. AArcel1]